MTVDLGNTCSAVAVNILVVENLNLTMMNDTVASLMMILLLNGFVTYALVGILFLAFYILDGLRCDH